MKLYRPPSKNSLWHQRVEYAILTSDFRAETFRRTAHAPDVLTPLQLLRDELSTQAQQAKLLYRRMVT